MKARYALLLLFICHFPVSGYSQNQTVGLFFNDSSAYNGYTLFSPLVSDTVYLIDNCGNAVHKWATDHLPAQSCYLLSNGDILRPAVINNGVFTSGGSGGMIERYNWTGDLTWSFNWSDSTHCQHHDIAQMPNGDVLILSWELHSAADAIAAGRNPSLLQGDLWSTEIVEIQPTGATGGNVVWQWHAWDHLIQDFDSTKANFGNISAHPELININQIGQGPAGSGPDWIHANSVEYNATLDQVMISAHNFNEVWIIDHSTTSAEAAEHAGGDHNKGGDLIYRWGNPAAYGHGTQTDQQLFGQHNAHWIPDSLPDGGKIMIFNNGAGRPDGNYSTVEIIDPATSSSGDYLFATDSTYLPTSPSWIYEANPSTSFFSHNISGAQRQPNGNTLICEGVSGHIFEIDSAGDKVWNYVVPVDISANVTQGETTVHNQTFRAYRYSPDYSAFTNHQLLPGNPIELNPLPSNCQIHSGSTSGLLSTPHVAPFLIFPNPTHDRLNFSKTRNSKSLKISIYNGTGALVKKVNTSINTSSIDVSELSNGIYVIKFTTDNQSNFVRFIKE